MADGRGYQGFGSFFVETSVQELIEQAEKAYAPPYLPFADPVLVGDDGRGDGGGNGGDGGGGGGAFEFGAAARRSFLVDFEQFTFLNHGAFGAVAKPVQAAADAWRARCEANPLRFLDRELLPHLVRVTRELAAFVNAPSPADVVLMPNATTALNVVVSSVADALGPGDAFFCLSVGYGSVAKMLAAAAARTGARVVTAAVPPALTCADEVVELVADALPPNARLAVFDAVTSNTALLLPLERLIALCRAKGVPVLVDGAHALGMLPLDLAVLAPDYFVANCHKWLCGARGSAMLYVARGRHEGVRPLVISHGNGAGFFSSFVWDGCRDYAPLLAVSTALRFWRRMGAERARRYMRALLDDAVTLLCDAWGTHAYAPPDLRAPSMALVALPAGVDTGRSTAAGDADASASASATTATSPPFLDSSDAKWVQDALYYAHAFEAPVKAVGGALYVRVSAAVYNVRADYERLAAAVLSMVDAPDGGSGG